MNTHRTTPPAPTRAVRLIFEFEGEQLRLVSQQPVTMAITGFDLAQAQQAGYYVDTRDANGQTLARVPARDAFAASAEVFPEQPGEPITRVDIAQPRGAFTVVVPAPDIADHVAVVQIAPDIAEAPAPGAGGVSPVPSGPQVTELASFPLSGRAGR